MNELDLSPSDDILDVSAGTGQLAEMISERFGPFKSLVLNDPSEQMLAKAKIRMKAYDDVTYTGYFAEKLTYNSDSFSQIICLNSFHYYTEQVLVLAHFRRVLKPEGTLWLLDWNRTGLFRVMNQLIGWFSPEHINTRTLDETKTLLKNAGFAIQNEMAWSYKWWNFFFVRCIVEK